LAVYEIKNTTKEAPILAKLSLKENKEEDGKHVETC